MTHEAPLVRATGIQVTYQPTAAWLRLFIRSAISEPVHALRGIDLELLRGEILGVVGPNGAGKSTLFRVLTGLLIPSHGNVTVMGHQARTAGTEMRRHIGFMPPDDRTLFLRQTCLDNLRFRGHLLGMKGQDLERRAAEVLEVVDLSYAANRAAVALSSGMRFRLMLARALLGDPKLLILDEPTGPLDPVAAHDFIATLHRLVRERSIGAIVSSHRMDDIESMPDRVMLIDRGQVRYDGPVDDLRRSTLRRRIVLTTTSRQAAGALAAAVRGVDESAEVTIEAREVHVASDVAVGILLAGVQDLSTVVDVQHQQANLREVLTGVIRDGGA